VGVNFIEIILRCLRTPIICLLNSNLLTLTVSEISALDLALYITQNRFYRFSDFKIPDTRLKGCNQQSKDCRTHLCGDYIIWS